MVKNFWPWVSHAISSTPRAYVIWNILIWAHAPIRFLGSRLLYNSYKLLFTRMIDDAARQGKTADTSFGCCCCNNYKVMIACAHLINNLEIICLLSLSVVTSHSVYGRLTSTIIFISLFFSLIFLFYLRYSCLVGYSFYYFHSDVYNYGECYWRTAKFKKNGIFQRFKECY